MKIQHIILLIPILLSPFGKCLTSTLILKTCVNNKVDTNTLNEHYLQKICEKHKTLVSNDPDCFDSKVIKNQEKAFTKLKELGGKTFTIQEKNDQPDISCIFFDRSHLSDVLLVIGVGFPVPKERILPFVKLFPHYSIVSFDYAGVGKDHNVTVDHYYELLWKWRGLLSWKIAKADFNISKLGTTEENQVITVIDHCKKEKKYKQVFGLALCFSTYTFSKAAAKNPTLFDKLIFDNSWPSIDKVIKRIIKNPSHLCSVENPHSPLPCITHHNWFQVGTLKLLEYLLWLDLHTLPLSHYLSKLICPIMFIQSVNDCYCTEKEFDILWKSVATNKTVLFTQNLHGRNHVRQPEIYTEFAHNFFCN
jgi:hypothetical protein